MTDRDPTTGRYRAKKRLTAFSAGEQVPGAPLDLPARPCVSCGNSYKPRRRGQKHCRKDCRLRAHNTRLARQIRKAELVDRLARLHARHPAIACQFFEEFCRAAADPGIGDALAANRLALTLDSGGYR